MTNHRGYDSLDILVTIDAWLTAILAPQTLRYARWCHCLGHLSSPCPQISSVWWRFSEILSTIKRHRGVIRRQFLFTVQCKITSQTPGCTTWSRPQPIFKRPKVTVLLMKTSCSLCQNQGDLPHAAQPYWRMFVTIRGDMTNLVCDAAIQDKQNKVTTHPFQWLKTHPADL